MNVCVIIPAAGSSTRFGRDKLGQDLGGRALLIRTVELFTKRDEVRSIIVAGPPEEYESFRERYAPTLSFHGATLVEGGSAERWETVKNAIIAAPEDCTHIAVHDAARPVVSQELITRVFQAAETLDAVIPAVPITATVKRVEDAATEVSEAEDDAIADSILGDAGRVAIPARRVIETVDRGGLVAVQTPQVFRAELLRRAYAQERLDGATDDASLVERLGEPVHVVEGDAANIKVTTPRDFDLVRALLGVKPTAERPAHKRF